MIRALVLLALALSACAPADAPADAPPERQVDPGDAAALVFTGSEGRWVDLTHAFDERSVYWPTARTFSLDTVSFGVTPGGWFYSAFDFSAAEHGGTHLDAPIHFAEGTDPADRIPLSRLIGPAVVVDASQRMGPDSLIGVADLQRFESEHGRLPDGVIVLLRTGWDERYPDPARYLGTERRGAEAIPELHFPGLAPEAARWLVSERSIGAIGIDTPSIDFGQSSTFESHVALYGANVPGFENLTGLGALPPTGSFVVALPMKIRGGSGAPLRIVAYVPG